MVVTTAKAWTLPRFAREIHKLLNKSFRTVALRTQISIFTTSSGKRRLSKDEQFISANFDTLFIEIHYEMPEIWSFKYLWIKFWKWHLRLLTGLNSHCNSEYCACLYDRQFQICSWSCSCSESLFNVLQNVPVVDSILHYLLLAVISHTTKLHIWIWWYKKHTTSFSCCSGCKSSQ